MIIWILRSFIESTRDYVKVIHWFLRIFPSYSLGYGLINCASIKSYAIEDEGITDNTSPWDVEIAGGDLHFLLWSSFVYFGLIFVVEHIK